MIPVNGPLLFPPIKCKDCEYFFLLDAVNRSRLGCCIIHNAHISQDQVVCAWRHNATQAQNALAWSRFAVPWIQAYIEYYSGDPRAIEIIMLDNISKESAKDENLFTREKLDLQAMPRPRVGPDIAPQQ